MRTPTRQSGRPAALPVLLLACATLNPPGAGAFTEIVSFGDSLSDTGNLFAVTGNGFNAFVLRLLFPDLDPPIPSAPYFEGRFSNGPVWVEHVALGLGLAPLAPSERGGSNWAVGGATTGDDGSFLINLILPDDVEDQVEAYIDTRTPTGTALFVLEGGANDLLSGGETDVTVPVNRLTGFIRDLHQHGGRHFLVPNLPPLGRIPSEVGGPDAATLTARAAAFNARLATALDLLEGTLEGIAIYPVDVFGMFEDIVADPLSFGFTNITDPAFDESTGNVVPNPDAYLFWDDIHPTSRAHAMYGARALAAIPEPASAAGLVIVGLVLCLRRPRLRTQGPAPQRRPP